MPEQAWQVVETLFPESAGKRLELYSSLDPMHTRPGWTHVAYRDMADKPSLCSRIVDCASGKPRDMTVW